MDELTTPPPRGELVDAVAGLLGRPPQRVRPLGSGSEHNTYLVDDGLVARIPRPGSPLEASEVEREVRLLDLLAEVVTVEVPRVVAHDPASGLVITTRVEGVSMLDAVHPSQPLVDPLAEVIEALAGATERAIELEVAAPDPHPLSAFREEAMAALAAVADALSTRQRALAADLLSGPLPPEPTLAVLCHHDLGAEHLMVDPREPTLIGVIDWSDAAIADPARDLGRLLRDLGPAPARAIAARLPFAGDPHLWDRIALHARCSLLEDLEFGLEHDDRYAAAALGAFDRTFATDR